MFFIRCIKNAIFLFGVLVCALCNAEECNESLINAKFYSGEYELAYAELTNCRDIEALKGETLNKLFKLTMYLDYGDYSSIKERLEFSFSILKKSALKGHIYAVFNLSTFYINGLPVLGIDPNSNLSECLEYASVKVLAKDVITAKVRACLSKYERPR